MNLSTLSGDSLAAILPAGADYTTVTTTSTGVAINYTGKGVFGLLSGAANAVIRLTVDGVQYADMTHSEILLGLGIYTGYERFRFNKSLRVEVVSYVGGNVTVNVLGA